MLKTFLLRTVPATILLLLIPALAMSFTDEVVWTGFDFAVAAALLLGAGLAFQGIVQALTQPTARHVLAAAMAVGGALALVWINLAVGMIGAPGHPANLLYGIVLAILIAGVVLARGQMSGVRQTLAWAAAAQAVITVLTPLLWSEHAAPVVHLANVAFALSFGGAAMLFQPPAPEAANLP